MLLQHWSNKSDSVGEILRTPQLGIITVELILQERTVYQRYIVGPFPTIRIVESNQDWCCPFNYNAKKTQPGNHLRVCSIRLHFYFLSLKKTWKTHSTGASMFLKTVSFRQCLMIQVLRLGVYKLCWHTMMSYFPQRKY